MRKKYVLIIILISFINSSSQDNSTQDSPPPYTFNNLYSVGIYVQPSENNLGDMVTQNVLKLHFQSLGYHVVDLNRRLDKAGKMKKPKFKENLGYICSSNRNSPEMVDIAVCVESTWKRYRKRISYYGDLVLPILISHTKLINVHTGEIIIEGVSSDTIHVYNMERKRIMNWKISTNGLQNIVERNLTKFIDFFPVCSYLPEDTASFQIPLLIFADQNYRDHYGYKWKTMLLRRMVFVNDIYRKYFDIEFNVIGYKEWETYFQDSLDYVLDQLIGDSQDIQDTIVLAVVLDPTIVFNRIIFSEDRDDKAIGKSMLLINRCVTKDLPTTKDLRIWDSVEESVVMVHELAHLLGATHILDPRSNMFPSAGTLSYEFDDFNTNIINLTKKQLFNLKKTSELRQYVREILQIFDKCNLKNVSFSGLIGILASHYVKQGGSEDSLSYIFENPWTYHTARGYIYYDQKEWEKSIKCFKDAIKENKELASLYWDLARVYQKLEKENKVRECLEKARDKGMKIQEF